MADNSQSNVIVTCVKCGAQYQCGVIGQEAHLCAVRRRRHQFTV